jgi:hypothetical protein
MNSKIQPASSENQYMPHKMKPVAKPPWLFAQITIKTGSHHSLRAAFGCNSAFQR